MRIVHSLAAILFLAMWLVLAVPALTQESDASNPRADPSLPSDTRAAYFELKRAADALYAAEEERRKRGESLFSDPNVGLLGGDPGLQGCSGAYIDAGYQFPGRADSLLSLASHVIYTRRTLQHHGFPSDTWLALLKDFEEVGLTNILSAEARAPGGPEWIGVEDVPIDILEKLAVALNDYRRGNNLEKKYPEVYVGGECGDGEVLVDVKTSPPGAHLWFISEFSFRLCEVRRVDPLDLKNCDGWFEQVQPGVAWLAGDYHYTAVWPDGERTSSVAPFHGPNFSSAEGGGGTILIER